MVRGLVAEEANEFGGVGFGDGDVFDAGMVYFGKDAYADMVKDSKYTANKELLIIPGASHTDLYDGGGRDAIPFDKLQSFFEEYLK